MSQLDFSEDNVANSLAVHLAEQLLAADYLVYWLQADMVQTPDGYYGDYRAQQSAYRSDATFGARFDAARGLVTLVLSDPANPAFAGRLPSDGTVGTASSLPLPVLALNIDPAIALDACGLGMRERWRVRPLLITAQLRDTAEQRWFADALGVWFDTDTCIDVRDHVGGTLTVHDHVRVCQPLVDRETTGLEPDSTRWDVSLSAQLEYTA